MFKAVQVLLLFLGVIAIQHSVEATHTGPAYTNAEAIKRGLPLLKPRLTRLSSRTESALRKRASQIIRQKVLNFDDLGDASGIPEVPVDYQGLTWSSAHYYNTDGPYMPESLPNALFYASDFSGFDTPTFQNPSGLLRVQSLYCRRGRGDTLAQNMLMVGKLNGATLFTETLDCGTCIDCSDPPAFNSFSNLPLVDTITFEAGGQQRSSGMIDNIALTLID